MDEISDLSSGGKGLQRSKFVRPLGEDVRVFLADEACAWDSPFGEGSDQQNPGLKFLGM